MKKHADELDAAIKSRTVKAPETSGDRVGEKIHPIVANTSELNKTSGLARVRRRIRCIFQSTKPLINWRANRP